MGRLEINLETKLDNERLQFRQDNATIKELEEELENSLKIIQYTNYRPPQAGKSFLFIKIDLDPLIISLQK